MGTERCVGSASIGAACLAAALLAGCSDRAAASVPVTQPQSAQASQSGPGGAIDPALHLSAGRCMKFDQDFDVLAACQRADGTLQAFTAHDISWRVRYFVRYWRMPCNEAPTIEEGYIYHMVTNDLYNDPDLNNKKRMAIRTVMFEGKVECR